MRLLWSLVWRNTLVYLKDKAAVFFSLLSVLMILVLYVLFLADVNINSVLSMIPSGGNVVPPDRQMIAFLVNSWVMAGIIAVNSLTVSLGVLGIMVEDESQKRMPSFLVSPASRLKLTLGYILSAFFVGTVLCALTFALAQAYIFAAGGSLLTVQQAVQVFGIILLSVFSSTCFVFFLVCFIRTINTYTSISIIVGTLIGFLAGVYLPVGSLPSAVQSFIKCVPVFYNASLLRGIFMDNPVAEVFKNIPQSYVSGYLESMGTIIRFGSTQVSELGKAGIVAASGALFLLLSVWVMGRRRMSRI